MQLLGYHLDFLDISWEGGFVLAVMVVFMVLLHFIAEPVRWWIYTTTNEDGPPLSRYISVFNLSALASYTMPFKMGVPARIWLVSSFLDVEARLIVTLMVADGFLYYGLWSLAGAISGYGYLDLLITGATSNTHFWLFGGSLLLLCAVIAWRLGKRGLFKGVITKIGRLGEFMPLRRLVVVVAIVVADFLVQVGRHWLIARGLSVDMGFGDMSRITAIAISVGMLSFLPLGLGAYDVTLTALLVSHGVSLHQAIAVPLVNRVLSYAVAIVAGGVGAHSLRALPAFRGGLASILRSLGEKRGKGS